MGSVPYHVEQERYTGPASKNGVTGLRSIPEQRKHSAGRSRGPRRKESRADPSSPAERQLQEKKSPASYPERGFAQDGPPQAAYRAFGPSACLGSHEKTGVETPKKATAAAAQNMREAKTETTSRVQY